MLSGVHLGIQASQGRIGSRDVVPTLEKQTYKNSEHATGAGEVLYNPYTQDNPEP